MQHIQAIGFDLFDTLVTVARSSRYEAPGRLLRSLQAHGIAVDEATFTPVYREVVQEFTRLAKTQGIETHNRFWISTTLQRLGYAIAPDDSRITQTVEAYFSAFLDYAELLPDTVAMLSALKGCYRLGLLSNLTHAPAAHQILERLGLTAFFDVILVSGDLGYRKPHPQVFQQLATQLELPHAHIAFVGDDLEADISGAQQAGLQPIWTTYARTLSGATATGQEPTAPPNVPAIDSWPALLALLRVS